MSIHNCRGTISHATAAVLFRFWYYQPCSQMLGREGVLSSRPSCSPLDVSASLSLILRLPVSMLVSPATFISSAEGVIYVFFIITDPLCLWHLPLYGEKIQAALVGAWL